MILYINTIKNNSEKIEIGLSDKDKKIAVKLIPAKYQQAEKLLLAIDKLLSEAKIKINRIKQIKVENRGGSFTALRIGVITANTLGYTLNIPVISAEKDLKKTKKFNIIEPLYSKEPNITQKKLRRH